MSYYVILNNQNQNMGVTTSLGQAEILGGRNNGFFTLKDEDITLTIRQLEEIVRTYVTVSNEQERFIEEWKESNATQFLTTYYQNKADFLEKEIDKLYDLYYQRVHELLTADEINEIQRNINFNFMSDIFINKLNRVVKNKYNNEV